LHGIRDDNGWTVAHADSPKVLYRHEKGTQVHSIKFEASFDAPVEHLLSLAREFDLTKTWNKFCTDSVILSEPSIFESYVYGSAWMLFPFPQMDTLVHAHGVDLAQEDRSLLIVMSDPTDMPANAAELPKAARKRKRASVLPGSCIRLEPLPVGPDGKHRVKATALTHINPGIPYVPPVLLNFVLKVMSPFMHRQMVKLLKDSFADPKQALPQRIQHKPELYEWVRQRVVKYLDIYYPAASI
jgi:hypothetical protein